MESAKVEPGPTTSSMRAYWSTTYSLWTLMTFGICFMAYLLRPGANGDIGFPTNVAVNQSDFTWRTSPIHYFSTPANLELRVLSQKPRIYMIDDFLTESEIQELILRANASRSPHFVSAKVEAEDHLLQHILKRMHRTARVPDRFGEGLQFFVNTLNSTTGKPTIPQKPRNDSDTTKGVLRIASVFTWLSVPEEGGDAIFPLNRTADCTPLSKCCGEAMEGVLRVPAKAGRTVVLYNVDFEGQETPMVEYGFCPATKGSAWMARRWFRGDVHYNVLGERDPRFDGLVEDAVFSYRESPWEPAKLPCTRFHGPPRTLEAMPPIRSGAGMIDEECDHLVALAEKNLTLGRIGGGGGGVADTEIRSSQQFYTSANDSLADPVLRGILKKLQRAARVPDRLGETLQVGRYQEGEKYEIHHDSSKKGPAMWRPCTIITYLKDMPEGGGGHTLFIPFNDERCRPLSRCCHKQLPGTYMIAPKKGRSVLFFSYDLLGKHDPASRHAACPVVEGEKWIAQRWFEGFDFEPWVHKLDPAYDGLPGMTEDELSTWKMEHFPKF